MRFSFNTNSKGHLIQRESHDLEFKANFHFGDSIAEYMRSAVGMANNRGGELMFGISDSPRKLIGLSSDKFENCDAKILTQFILDYFSHDFEWGMETISKGAKTFGRLWVSESKIKPIVTRKNFKNILREGAIYYRYRGQTCEIKYSELSALLQEEREKEKALWISHIEKIGRIGPSNIHLLDTYNGELHTGHGKILIDKNIADNLKFIKEGEFVEKNGAPTLMLMGKIEGISNKESLIASDELYPYFFGDLKSKFKINSYQANAILWKFNAKENRMFHTEIKSGAKQVIHKYSEAFVETIKEGAIGNKNYFTEVTEEFRSAPKK